MDFKALPKYSAMYFEKDKIIKTDGFKITSGLQTTSIEWEFAG